MASDYRLISPATGTTLYLVNSTGTPLADGSPFSPATTPFGIDTKWTPDASEPVAAFQGGAPLVSGSRLAYLTNANIEETIPLVYLGSNADLARAAVQKLRRQFATLFAGPCLLYARPNGATEGVYFELETVHLIERAFSGTATSPGEGQANLVIDLKVVRQPYGGASSLEGLHSSASLTNTGTGTPDNDLALELNISPLKGDLVYEGQPLNIQFNKPTSQAASTLLLASVASRTYQSIASTLSGVTSTTTGSTFTASTAIDISTLRTRRGARLRVIGRLTTITAPTKAQVRLTIQTASGNTLWVGQWQALPGSNTTAQLIDLQGSSLDAIRSPLTGTASVILVVALRSSDGTAVTATLSYLEALLVYDFAIVEAASGLGSSQSYQCLAAQNMSGGGWLPLIPAQASVRDSSDVLIKTAVIYGTLPRAFSGASLWVAWRESDGGHTASDTATISISHAPLYRSLRGAG
jgi:hypothetical protein